MARKKIVLVIVEGPSDDTALGIALNQVYDRETVYDAYTFAKKYQNDRDGFVKYICNSAFSVVGDYKESWQHISYNTNSVERYTNLCIAIQKALESH